MSSFFLNTLGFWGWLGLLSVPPAIVALYFLKLRRRPLEVPSTYLWRRTLEDLHVNSFWQRLRSNLLLLLQLLVMLLAMLACLRPGWKGEQLIGHRFIFLIDASASMTATDVSPTRLDEARKQALAMIDQMQSGDVGMVISFSDSARVEQQFTDNRRALRRAVANIKPTQRTTDLSEALQAAAGLANPASQVEAQQNVKSAAEALPATVYILSDGGFPVATNFSRGNLTPVYVPIGSDQADNLAVTVFRAERATEGKRQVQAVARIENFGPAEVETTAELARDGAFLAREELKLPPGKGKDLQFDLGDLESGVLTLTLPRPDALLLDNVAYAAVGLPHRTKVLLVSDQEKSYLEASLTTPDMLRICDLSQAKPDLLGTKLWEDQTETPAYDLVIFDRCAPPKKMPQANTLFLVAVPPDSAWRISDVQKRPLIVDSDRSHPLMQYLNLEKLTIVQGRLVQPPVGGAVLIDSDLTPPAASPAPEGAEQQPRPWGLLAIAPRAAYQDAVLGFELLARDEKGDVFVNTDWPIRLSFPVFMRNVLDYLGGNQGVVVTPGVQPGRPITLRTESAAETIDVQSPSGNHFTVKRQGQGAFIFTDTEEPGVYQMREGAQAKVTQRFSVNLFDARESNLVPRPEIYPDQEAVAGQSNRQTARVELWKWLLLGLLGVAMFEWYVFNRRVYL